MYQEIISLEKALLLEQEEKIILYNPNSINSIFSTVKQWKENWDSLRKKYRHVNIQKLSSFVNFEYLIEYKFIEDDKPTTVNWVYMYGQSSEARMKLDEANSKGKYVYILTNVAYPGICKIGKAITPSKRIKQINGAGTISEWELKYAIPVSDDYKVESEVHKILSYLRMNSFQGSNREFFDIEFENAVSVIENIASEFKTGKSIFY
jgi:hypothetical protein